MRSVYDTVVLVRFRVADLEAYLNRQTGPARRGEAELATMSRLELKSDLARQFLEALYGPYYSRATRLSYLEVRGRQEVDPPGTIPFNRFYLGFENLLKDMSKWKPEFHHSWLCLFYSPDRWFF